MRFLEEQLVALNVEAASPKEAIRKVGGLLVSSNLVEEKYIDAMIDSYDENGPYFVLAPNIALPHARPEDGVKEASVSMIRLKHPIKFGHKTNDPVQFVFALGASSSDEHLELLKKITSLLNEPSHIEAITKAENYKEIQNLVGGKL